eukprot:8293640-Pyramimonas_sp.AAC.1
MSERRRAASRRVSTPLYRNVSSINRRVKAHRFVFPRTHQQVSEVGDHGYRGLSVHAGPYR